MHRLAFILLSSAFTLHAAANWFDLVAPVMSTAEKKAYQNLTPEARSAFEQNFWTNKSIAAPEYFRRIQYVDSAFGSSKPASGANTDPGRVYLSLGAPNRITRLASSRTFVPLEIWYYDHVPALGLGGELRLIFFQKDSQGLPKLYSPTLDSLRSLLIPQPGTLGMFGPNDSITEADIRTKLAVGPVEEEVISAAVGVSNGVKYSGNDEILAKATSPELMLRQTRATEVTSRLLLNRPRLTTIQTPSPFGGMQVDLKLEVTARREIDLEILDANTTVYANRVMLDSTQAGQIEYLHRLDLLPGTYRLRMTIDGESILYPLPVSAKPETGQILRADLKESGRHRQTPFEYDGKQYDVNDAGKYVVIPLSEAGRVLWTIRKGFEVVWRWSTNADLIATVELPMETLSRGSYRLEVNSGADSRSLDLTIQHDTEAVEERVVLSYNANLFPALRYSFVGHQWLLRGQIPQAREALGNSLQRELTVTAEVELARVDAAVGHLDEARDRVRRILAEQPRNFDALSVLAYIETKFQDYAVAAELYRKALSVQESPAIRIALAQLPSN